MKKFIDVLTLLAVFISFSIPVIADESFTVENSVIKSEEEYLSLNISTPYFKGFKSADKVNQVIRSLIVDSIGDARLNAKDMEQLDKELNAKGEESFVHGTTLDTSYNYSKNGNLLSVYLQTYYYSGGAHPINWINTITINTETGETYSFKDLFKENATASKIIEDKIIEQIEKNPEPFFAEYRDTIKAKNGDFDYYFDGSELVIYFGIYDIAPYSSGTSYFSFKANEIKDLLETEIYDSIKIAKTQGSILLNGNDIGSKSSSYVDEGVIMVPLRAIAEALAHKVDWNKADGAIVDGTIVKNGAILKNNVTFVPIEYFTEVLKENVSWDNDIIRIFSKNELQYGFNDLVIKFENPSDINSAVEMYAKSVKERNGAIQFALMDKANREINYSNFDELNFVTGVSSPWVDSYETLKTGDNDFKITFHLKTSQPTDVITMVSDIKLIDVGNTFRISSLINSDK